MSFINTVQNRFKQASIVEKFIYINVAVFVLIFVVNTFGYLFQIQSNFFVQWFTLPATFDGFISKPWTIITYGFIHVNFIHILSNIIALFFIGNLFVNYFTAKQFVNFYLLGTLFGGILYLLSYNYFPAFSKDVSKSVLLGASAGVSAIFAGIATYMPNYQLKFPLIGFVKLWYLAAIWVALDVIQIPAGNAGGHLAHIGGALFGFLYVNQASNKKLNILGRIMSLFTVKKKPFKNVYKTKTNVKKSVTKNEHQEKIDHILDKISKSGYDTLSKEEKAFLFQQGKK